MIKYLLGGAAVAAVIAVAPAVAQSPQPAPAVVQPHIVGQGRGMDRVHTRAEVATHVRSLFERLDRDRDGFITRAEAQSGRASPADRAARRIQRRGDGLPGARNADRGAIFDRMDANRDGVISRDEFARAPMRQERRMVVRNGQGEDRRVRAIGGAGPMRGLRMHALGNLRGRMFDMADANRDGRVSLQEANTAAYRHFDMADVNRDGQITRDERRQMRQQMRERLRAERRAG